MTGLVDVVNFNADASCLSSAQWLAALHGGRQSAVCRWLDLYAKRKKKVSLGIVGATIADMAVLNPEAIKLIRDRPDVFEVVLRPFAHDIAPLRTPFAFEWNVRLGREVLERAFGSPVGFFLPPEFMITNGQIAQLSALGVAGIFINPLRFKGEVADRLPAFPYSVRGVAGVRLPCLPLQGRLTEAYLKALHSFGAEPWNRELSSAQTEWVASWRDGESFLFLPDGLVREDAWLETEDRSVERLWVREVAEQSTFSGELNARLIQSYPVHSFTNWVREFRMLGYLRRLDEVERRLPSLSPAQKVLWLHAIGSDVLSSVEKDAPTVILRPSRDSDNEIKLSLTLARSERGFEGEEFLVLLEQYPWSEIVARYIEGDPSPHLIKHRARLKYLSDCGSLNS